MIVLAEPAPEDMVQAIKKAINILPNIDPEAMHLRVSQNPLYLCVNLL
jgi:phosphatidylinositol N-acetylglucosaminyltransferase subunit A